MSEEWESKNVDIIFDEDADLRDIAQLLNIYHAGLFDEFEME